METQLTAEDVRQMRLERRDAEIVTAHNEGRLDELLGVSSATTALYEKVRGTEQLTKQDVKALYALREFSTIVAADAAGRINYEEKE